MELKQLAHIESLLWVVQRRKSMGLLEDHLLFRFAGFVERVETRLSRLKRFTGYELQATIAPCTTEKDYLLL